MDSVVSYALIIAVVAGVLFALSAVLTAIAKPKGRDLELIQSGFPGEVLLDYRVCNACLKDAEPNAIFDLVMNAMNADASANVAFAFIKTMTGGLWVGGRVFLTSHRVIFMPNAMNRAVHKSLSIIAVRLADVTEVVERFGFVTKIIDIKTNAGALTVRGYKSSPFAAAIRDARAARARAA